MPNERPVEQPVVRPEPERTVRRLLTPDMIEAEDAAGGVVAAGALARPTFERCPYCHGPAPGWSSADLWRGSRMAGDVKQYHCREAAV